MSVHKKLSLNQKENGLAEKRSNYFHFGLILLTCLTALFSCTNDSDEIIDVRDNIPEVKEKIFATFTGLVLTENDELIEDADVSIGGEFTTTDENGYFTLSGFFNPDGANLLVSKQGYFDATGLVIPYADVPVNTKIRLIEKSNPVMGESNLVIEYEVNDAKVVFQENSYTLNGAKYTGTVDIFGTTINFDDPNYSELSPGSLETVEDGELKMLLPFGRVNVELFSDAGERLDIDSPAEITFDIADGLVQDAPEEVSLYFLDKTTGYWVEDGVAFKSGSTYVGSVSHFTDWCAALSSELFTISGIVTRDGEPFGGANMGYTRFNYRFAFNSASDGSYATRVFEGADIILDVSDQCGTPVHEEFINQVSMDIVQDIDVPATNNSFSVNGNIFCDTPDAPVENGYVLIVFDNNEFANVVSTDEEGNFSFFYEECANQMISLVAVAPNEDMQSRQIQLSGNSENLTINVCEQELEGSITFNIDGEEPYIISGCTVEIVPFDDLPGVPGFTYIFRARDTYDSLPDVTGEFADYEVRVNVSVPGEIQLPLGPIASPLFVDNGLSENPPFWFDILPADVNILFEDDQVVEIETNTFAPIVRNIDISNREELNGNIILRGVKI